MIRRAFLSLGMLAAVALALSPVAAQEQPDRPPVSFEQNIRINDAMLQRFAQAHARVQRVDARFAEELERADGDEEAMEIMIRASVERAEAMRSTGMALEEYNLILVHINADAGLRADIDQRTAALGN